MRGGSLETRPQRAPAKEYRIAGARAKERRIARARLRRAMGGFTLIELLVVVVMISILAVIATPQMRVARDDRLAFDYARRVEQMFHRARARAAGRGAAHLVVAVPSGANRGRFLLFEALDGTLPAAAGPNPVSTCKAAGEWDDAVAFVPGAVSNNARIVDGIDLNTTGINAVSDIRSAFSVGATGTPALAMCVSPSGTTFVGVGADMAAAIANMQAKTVPFTSYVDVSITRNLSGSPVGLARHVLVAGSAAPRVKSQ